jgi:hypothetical protein
MVDFAALDLTALDWMDYFDDEFLKFELNSSSNFLILISISLIG